MDAYDQEQATRTSCMCSHAKILSLADGYYGAADGIDDEEVKDWLEGHAQESIEENETARLG